MSHARSSLVKLGSYRLPNGGLLVLSQGSVVHFEGDAIVNAANEECLTGGGVDGAIGKAGGKELLSARKQLPILEGMKRCLRGNAVITIGGKLPATYCIHAVGPNYNYELDKGDDLLISAYSNALARAKEHGLKTVAFSLISSGVYRGPHSLEHVLEIGVRSIRDFAYAGAEEIVMCAFTSEEAEALTTVAEGIFASKSLLLESNELNKQPKKEPLSSEKESPLKKL